MPHKKDYYQSTIPESIQIRDRTYVTLELLNQARRDYRDTRRVTNLLTRHTRKPSNDRLAAANARYSREDAEYCIAHTLTEIMQHYQVSRARAYQMRNYLSARFNVGKCYK